MSRDCAFSTRERRRETRAALLALSLTALSACQQTRPATERAPTTTAPTTVESSDIEGAARGFPAMRSASGELLAHGDFTQRIEDGLLHVQIRYEVSTTHWIEEVSVFQQEPRLVQKRWSWSEHRDSVLVRSFDLDFSTGSARAEKLVDGTRREWSEQLELEPGRAFAGSGFTLAIKGVRERLLDGEKVEFQTVGFTPKPKAVTVEISHQGLDALTMGGREVSGDRFVVHPKLNWLVHLFVDAPDTHLWLTDSEPAAFLRFEGPLAEPGDPLIRVDLLPGAHSGDAVPVAPSLQPRDASSKREVRER